jgi:transposase
VTALTEVAAHRCATTRSDYNIGFVCPAAHRAIAQSRRIRPPTRPVYLKLHFAAGECAQIDWGCYGTVAVANTRRRLSFFVMVLAFSRQMFVEFTVSQTMEHFLACHEHAFAALGVPSKVMVDNLKSAVLQRLAGVAPVFNPRYMDFARHHGFVIAPCNVARGNEKGRVESGVGYVKKNFLRGLELIDFRAIQAAAQVWLDTRGIAPAL